MAERNYGVIERGVIREVTEGGYVIESYDRVGVSAPPAVSAYVADSSEYEGLITAPLKAMNESTYSVGNPVYYFYFPDGTGKIICGF